MNLVQKLPVGIGLACMMLLSSCSKEDVLTPEPTLESVNANSNMKTDAYPWVPPTKGYAGIHTLPTFWERYNPSTPSDPAEYPTGTSNPSSLWGNSSFQWLQYMPTIPGQPWNSFVTIATSSKSNFKKNSWVKTKIRFLTPGKNYSFKFYVSSSLPRVKGRLKYPLGFAKRCSIGLSHPGITPSGYYVDLSNSKNTWVEKVITFKAKTSELDLNFNAEPEKEGEYAYAHIFVGQEAIVQIK